MVTALLAALLLVVAVKAGRAQKQDAAAALASACDLGAGPCTVSLPTGAVEVDLSPRPIPLASPLEVTVQVRGGDPPAGAMTITSVTMDMGTTRFALDRTAPGTLRGTDSLPICITGRMTWLAELTLAGQPMDPVVLRFDTSTP